MGGDAGPARRGLLGDADGVGAALFDDGVEDARVGAAMLGVEADLAGEAYELGACEARDEACAARAACGSSELGGVEGVGLEEARGAAEGSDEPIDERLAGGLLVVGVVARGQESALGVAACVGEEGAAEVFGGGQQEDRAAAAELLGAQRTRLGARGVERGRDE